MLADTVLPADVQSDTDAVIALLTSGKPLSTKVARRVRERAQSITDDVRRRHGTLDIGISAIRELRDA